VSKLLVTGATGLIGSVVAEQLRAQGDDVVALVRTSTNAEPIERLGVQVVRGDLTDPDSVGVALRGCDAAIHCAAAVGGPTQDLDSMRAVNVDGTVALLDRAREAQVARVVVMSTAGIFDASTASLTERSPLDPDPPGDPYTRTKTQAFHESMRRVESGQDIVFVLPGASYGPSPMGRRVVEIPGGDQRIARALRGETATYLPAAVPWSYTGDIARCTLAALERGVTGDRYIAFGAAGCVVTFPAFVNRACELAGVEHRVGDVPASKLDDPETVALFGPTLIAMARRRFAHPFFDDRATRERLGYQPVTLDQGLKETVDWMREQRLV
jgi:dihydroflavonol-4-reductase